MPLSGMSFEEIIKHEISKGKTQDQAVAIAYSVTGRDKKNSFSERQTRANQWRGNNGKVNFNAKHILSNWYDCKGLKASICEEYDKIYIDTPTQIISVDTMAQAQDWLNRNGFTKK